MNEQLPLLFFRRGCSAVCPDLSSRTFALNVSDFILGKTLRKTFSAFARVYLFALLFDYRCVIRIVSQIDVGCARRQGIRLGAVRETALPKPVFLLRLP